VFDSIVEKIRTALHPQPIALAVADRDYRVKTGPYGLELGELIVPPAKPTLHVVSLTGFRDAFEAGIDDFDEAEEGKSAVQVIDHETVALVSLEADENGRRHEWLRATNREKNPFPFDSYQVPETFLINLQRGFLPTEEIVQLQRLASSLTNESSIGTQDDGMSQTVTVKQGAVTKSEIPLPKRIKLFPYRTFREIDPVESEFLVRIKGEPGKLPTIALIEIDGSKWKHDTALLMKSWLRRELIAGTVIIA
jgi:hypothetical protein